MQALNVPCSLGTTGDWHASALSWKRLDLRETDGSVFGDYGLETGRAVPCREGTYTVANHIRACLDLLDEGKFANAE
ncbi:MAG: hypothetical protein LBG06_00220 [Deltaproteobacteria bacterium]|nr:hypothetical protein [Deltaproteobacteria bacterium]